MNWHKYALMLNDPNSNVEREIYEDITKRSNQEIIDLVDDNHDMLVGEAQRRLDIGIDPENVVEEIAKDFGRNFDFSPSRSLEWATLHNAIFEIVEPLSGGESGGLFKFDTQEPGTEEEKQYAIMLINTLVDDSEDVVERLARAGLEESKDMNEIVMSITQELVDDLGIDVNSNFDRNVLAGAIMRVIRDLGLYNIEEIF